MNDFFSQIEQKLDLTELDAMELIEYPYTQPIYNPEKRLLHRSITLGELMKNVNIDDLQIHTSQVIADIKSNYLVFDARYMRDLGHKEIYYKDLVPGSTNIAYELISKDKE